MNAFKKLALGVAMSVSSAGVPLAAPVGKPMTGDVAVSCQVVLCLAAVGSRPSECAKPMAKYFSIRAKKWKKTFRKRQAFLSLCPR